MLQPFDAVLLIAFGGPQAPADIRPFLENVLRGRRVAPGRVEEVAHHYELVGGRSPITELTMRQADGLRERLARAGTPLPVYVGMRNWHPYLADTLAEMSRAGIRRAVGVIAAAHRSYSSCTQYRENVADARAVLAREGLADVEITYVADWFDHPSFVAANAARVRTALASLEPPLRDRAELVFTAHSIPESMAARYPYREQFAASAILVAEAVRLKPDATANEAVRLKPDATADDAVRPKPDATADDVVRLKPGATAHDAVRLKPDATADDVVRLKPDATADDATSDVRRPPYATQAIATVYQSRSGRPEDPWLGPDICDYLRNLRARGADAVVVSPIGFVCDHVEVLYDLDIEAAEVCREIGLTMARAQAVNDHPLFLDMMADVVLRVCRRYERAVPLELVART